MQEKYFIPKETETHTHLSTTDKKKKQNHTKQTINCMLTTVRDLLKIIFLFCSLAAYRKIKTSEYR